MLYLSTDGEAQLYENIENKFECNRSIFQWAIPGCHMVTFDRVAKTLAILMLDLSTSYTTQFIIITNTRLANFL